MMMEGIFALAQYSLSVVDEGREADVEGPKCWQCHAK